MFQFGATIGPSRTPLFYNKLRNKNSMLPRPVVKSRPGSKHFDIFIKLKWLEDLTQGLARMVITHLVTFPPQDADKILHELNVCKEIVPDCLKLFKTFFNQLILIGQFETSGYMPIHFDKDDVINVVVTIGDNNMHGGATTFCDGLTESDIGCIVSEIPFYNGHIIIGEFRMVLHGVNHWCAGSRSSINFSFKKDILNHFIIHGASFYNEFVQAGYPRRYFTAY